MAQPLTTSPKARWGIPLVLPHVLLSVGLLIFAFVSEQPAQSRGGLATPEIASTTNAVSAAVVTRQIRRG